WKVRHDDCHVLRWGEALQRSCHGSGSTEVRAVVVRGVLLFVGRHVAQVRLHRCDIRLVLRVRELRNRDRGKDADDDDDDQKLDEGKTLLAGHSCVSLNRLDSGWKWALSSPKRLPSHCRATSL